MVDELTPISISIPDSAIPSLAEFIDKGHTRPPLQSRFDFIRQLDDPQFRTERFDPNLSEEDAANSRRILGEMLHLVLSRATTQDRVPHPHDLYSVYELATVTGGLSRLEVEELAPGSVEWLDWCCNPTPNTPDQPTHEGHLG